MITGALEGGSRYNFTSVPQIPATSIFNKALSCRISGMGNSRTSVLLGAILTAASTASTLCAPPRRDTRPGQPNTRSRSQTFAPERFSYYLWWQRYDRELADIFEVQDEVAAAIAGAPQSETTAVPAGSQKIPSRSRWLRTGPRR